MLRHMRTTIEIPDPIFHRAKLLAEQRGIPFRALVADGLRLLFREQPKKESFHLKDFSFKGDGLVAGLSETDWERIRDLAYEGHGA